MKTEHHGARHEHRRGHGPHHRHHERGHRGRLFDYGDLRLLVLSLIAERPRHGYELMRALEERTGGSYSPSPGVIYPTLSWLGDMGYAELDAEEGGRKSYRVTPEGESFLAANRAQADALFARLASAGEGRRHGEPDTVMRGMYNLKTALRLRLRSGEVDGATAERIAAALDAAALAVERA